MYMYHSTQTVLGLDANSKADVISALNNTSRYLGDILNLDNPFFDNLISSISPKELKLNKANNSVTSAVFYLDMSIDNGKLSLRNYDKRDDFNFDIVNFPYLDGDVPRSTFFGVYISESICFARSCSSVEDSNKRNQIIT